MLSILGSLWSMILLYSCLMRSFRLKTLLFLSSDRSPNFTFLNRSGSCTMALYKLPLFAPFCCVSNLGLWTEEVELLWGCAWFNKFSYTKLDYAPPILTWWEGFISWLVTCFWLLKFWFDKWSVPPPLVGTPKLFALFVRIE